MHGLSRFRVFGLVTDRAAKTLTHPDDMALTWTRADMADDMSRAHVAMLAWLLTCSDDIIQ